MNTNNFYEIIKQYRYTPKYIDQSDFLAIEPKFYISVKTKLKQPLDPKERFPQSNEEKPLRIKMKIDSLEKHLFNKPPPQQIVIDSNPSLKRTVIYTKSNQTNVNIVNLTEQELKEKIECIKKEETSILFPDKNKSYQDSEGNDRQVECNRSDVLNTAENFYQKKNNLTFLNLEKSELKNKIDNTNPYNKNRKIFTNTGRGFFLPGRFCKLNQLEHIRHNKGVRSSGNQIDFDKYYKGKPMVPRVCNGKRVNALREIHEFKEKQWENRMKNNQTFRQRGFLPSLTLMAKDRSETLPKCSMTELNFDYNFKIVKSDPFSQRLKRKYYYIYYN